MVVPASHSCGRRLASFTLRTFATEAKTSEEPKSSESNTSEKPKEEEGPSRGLGIAALGLGLALGFVVVNNKSSVSADAKPKHGIKVPKSADYESIGARLGGDVTKEYGMPVKDEKDWYIGETLNVLRRLFDDLF